MLPDIDPLYIFYAALAIAVVLVAEALYLLLHSSASYRDKVNRRLAVQSKEGDREKVLFELRRERGLSSEGALTLPLVWLNRMITQSGMRFGLPKLLLAAAAAAAAAAGLVYYKPGVVLYRAPAGLLAGLLLPVVTLKWLKGRRLNKFGAQFPEALDMIVRSLRAGHPVPVALNLVAREMPDPCGTEFGMVSDEITYGSDLDGALVSLYNRVGHEDLALFVTSISIQSATGGNLSEMLDNLSKLIRDRQKMRRKIRALSSEGKMSAYILGAAPFLIFFTVQWISPAYYGDIWHFPIVKQVLAGALGWMTIGILVMNKMIKFRF